ncbi:MAG: helix-turn-helix transcriptional regulator [Anaerolineae bacterium]|nr:helix-turn-helix transcriptional regulator [Anaerolineae bacterium]
MHGRGQGRWRRQGCSRRTARIMEPALLLLLQHGPAHGYTLLEQLGGFGLDEVNPSVVYRALRDMEERGWVTSCWDDEESQGPPRRVYRISPLGDEVLAWWTQDLVETKRMIDCLLTAYECRMRQDNIDSHKER